jgi:hypothetical protein
MSAVKGITHSKNDEFFVFLTFFHWIPGSYPLGIMGSFKKN